MTIQRITFEDRGQGFLWWEIDDASGRVVGCGPAQAWLWADGKCSVDLPTVRVGQCPRYFSPARGPEGAVLRYAIASVAPAEIGGGGWPL